MYYYAAVLESKDTMYDNRDYIQVIESDVELTFIRPKKPKNEWDVRCKLTRHSDSDAIYCKHAFFLGTEIGGDKISFSDAVELTRGAKWTLPLGTQDPQIQAMQQLIPSVCLDPAKLKLVMQAIRRRKLELRSESIR